MGSPVPLAYATFFPQELCWPQEQEHHEVISSPWWPVLNAAYSYEYFSVPQGNEMDTSILILWLGNWCLGVRSRFVFGVALRWALWAVELQKTSVRTKGRTLFCKTVLSGHDFLFLLSMPHLHTFQPSQQMEQGFYKRSHYFTCLYGADSSSVLKKWCFVEKYKQSFN